MSDRRALTEGSSRMSAGVYTVLTVWRTPHRFVLT